MENTIIYVISIIIYSMSMYFLFRNTSKKQIIIIFTTVTILFVYTIFIAVDFDGEYNKYNIYYIIDYHFIMSEEKKLNMKLYEIENDMKNLRMLIDIFHDENNKLFSNFSDIEKITNTTKNFIGRSKKLSYIELITDPFGDNYRIDKEKYEINCINISKLNLSYEDSKLNYFSIYDRRNESPYKLNFMISRINFDLNKLCNIIEKYYNKFNKFPDLCVEAEPQLNYKSWGMDYKIDLDKYEILCINKNINIGDENNYKYYLKKGVAYSSDYIYTRDIKYILSNHYLSFTQQYKNMLMSGNGLSEDIAEIYAAIMYYSHCNSGQKPNKINDLGINICEKPYLNELYYLDTSSCTIKKKSNNEVMYKY